MDIEDIKKNYRNFQDSKIISLAKSEARTLRPEVVPILIDEIRNRNLSETLISGIEAQLKVPTEDELKEYCSVVQSADCPKCKTKTQKLNAIVLNEVVSFLILTTSSKSIKIACPDCLEKLKNNANFKTATLGWWGFPWGVIRTIQALINNSKMSKQIACSGPNDILKSFVFENIGVIETSKNNTVALNNFIERTNFKK